MLQVNSSRVLLVSVGAAVLLRKYAHLPASPLSFLLTICTIFFIASSARVVWSCIIYPKYLSPLRRFPQPSNPSFFMGHFWEMMNTGPAGLFRVWVEAVPNEGIIRYLDIFNLERLVIVSPQALADVLVHNNYDFEKPMALRKGFSRILGMGLFLAEGETHKRQRKHLMPAFAYRHVKNLYPMFWDKSKDLIEALLASDQDFGNCNANGNASVEVSGWASRATLDIIGEGGFGHTFDALKNPDNELNRTYRDIFAPNRTGQILGIVGFLLPQWLVRRLPLLRNDKMRRASSFLKAYCHSLLESKGQMQHAGEKERGLDILTVAIDSGAFSDDDLVDQMMTFLAAGHETTASALTWAIYLLAKHPQIQSRLRDEVHANLPSPFANSASVVTAESIERLPYLNAFCREVLRLFPPVAQTIRVAVKDTTICGHFIPKNTTLLLPPWAVNTSTALWGADAAEFRPERWIVPEPANPLSDGSPKSNSNYGYLTFLHGPRSCIGQTFALGEFSCLLAAWVGAFETRLKDEDFVPVIKGEMVAKPKGGIHVCLKVLSDW